MDLASCGKIDHRSRMLTLIGLTARGLAPVDLEIATGECVSLSGPSGSGKTVLLRAIADLDPNMGEVRFNGDLRSQMPATDWRRSVGYMSPEPGWWADRASEHFLGRPVALLDALGLPATALDWTIRTMSTGERQRMALARLIERKPAVLLLDEPTAALDAAARQSVETLLLEYLADGAAALVVTHDPEQARRLGQRHMRIAPGTAGNVLREASPT